MSNCSCNCCNHGRGHDPGRTWLTPQEKQQLAERLDQRPDQSVISYKPGKGGNQAYLPGNVVFEIANSIFGFNGWSSSIIKVENDYTAEKGGRWHIGMTAYVRISLKDGTFHEEVGYGSADNMPNRSDAYKKCLKEAVTDAKKRALRLFGNAVGLCIADKDFVSAVKRGRGEEYQGAVETSIKKMKQLSDVKLQASDSTTTAIGPQSTDIRSKSAPNLNRTNSGTNALNPMPVGPTMNTSRNHPSVMQNLPSNKNQQGTVQNRPNLEPGSMQNPQSSSNIHPNDMQAHQRMSTMEHRNSPPNNQQQPSISNQYQRNVSTIQNPRPLSNAPQVNAPGQYTGPDPNYRQLLIPPQSNHIGSVQHSSTSRSASNLPPAAGMVRQENSVVNLNTMPHNMNANVNLPQGSSGPGPTATSKTIYDFQDLDDLCPGDYEAPR